MEKPHTAYTSTENQRASIANLGCISYGKYIIKYHGKITHKIHTRKIDWGRSRAKWKIV
nr:MAG TPA: hypothetical protein [Caudoviricetes sp.]